MSEKEYFQSPNEERCYPLSYFKWLMDYDKLEEMTLHEAKRIDVPGYFWCGEYMEPMDKSEGGCGKECELYAPRNGKSGCCRHYSLNFYEPTDKTITIRK